MTIYIIGWAAFTLFDVLTAYNKNDEDRQCPFVSKLAVSMIYAMLWPLLAIFVLADIYNAIVNKEEENE